MPATRPGSVRLPRLGVAAAARAADPDRACAGSCCPRTSMRPPGPGNGVGLRRTRLALAKCRDALARVPAGAVGAGTGRRHRGGDRRRAARQADERGRLPPHARPAVGHRARGVQCRVPDFPAAASRSRSVAARWCSVTSTPRRSARTGVPASPRTRPGAMASRAWERSSSGRSVAVTPELMGLPLFETAALLGAHGVALLAAPGRPP